MANRNRPPKSLKRRVETRPELKTVIVFCEGQVTEPDYLNGLMRLPELRQSTSLTVQIAEQHGMPRTLVESAIKQKRQSGAELDECWCLFDAESPQHHPYLVESVNRAAETPGVHVAVSNPCFEVWLLMHFTDVARYLSTKEAT